MLTALPSTAAGTRIGRRLPRQLHPAAWWLWAAGLVLAVLGLVVTLRRTEAPWARGFRYYLWFALTVVLIRVLFRSVFTNGVAAGDHVLFTLPRLHAPRWYAGVQFGGPVSLEASVAAAIDGLRLACLLCCVGAANTLANPKRAQLVESVQRVRRARRLRAGRVSGLRALRGIAVPVLEDALERSLRLAAAMDSRGYGRHGSASPA